MFSVWTTTQQGSDDYKPDSSHSSSFAMLDGFQIVQSAGAVQLLRIDGNTHFNLIVDTSVVAMVFDSLRYE